MLQWSEMLQQGIQPTHYTYNAKVKVESSVGDFDEALHTVQEMEAHGIKPYKVTWDSILLMAEQMNRSDVVQQVSSHQYVLLVAIVSCMYCYASDAVAMALLYVTLLMTVRACM